MNTELSKKIAEVLRNHNPFVDNDYAYSVGELHHEICFAMFRMLSPDSDNGAIDFLDACGVIDHTPGPFNSENELLL